MKTIFKYQIEVTDTQEIQVPKDAMFLKIDMQFNIPCIWFLVNPDNEKELKIIRIFGTGHTVDTEKEILVYMDTFLQNNGQFVWHVFEKIL